MSRPAGLTALSRMFPSLFVAGCLVVPGALAAPPEVSGLVFADQFTLAWEPAAEAASYNVYRGSLRDVPADQGTSIASSASTSASDADVPAAGRGLFYLVTAVDAAGVEGPRGLPPAPTTLCAPVIDGLLGASEWPAGWEAANTVASDWGAGNTLAAIRACYDFDTLYLAIEGSVEQPNTITVFIDRNLGWWPGVTDPIALEDYWGHIDPQISRWPEGASWPAGFGADAAWATLGMNTKAEGELNSVIGLRDLADPAAFRPMAEDRAVCSDMTRVCEIAIPWTALYGPAGRPRGSRIALFARLGYHFDRSNQALPQDDPDHPETVRTLLTFAPVP